MAHRTYPRGGVGREFMQVTYLCWLTCVTLGVLDAQAMRARESIIGTSHGNMDAFELGRRPPEARRGESVDQDQDVVRVRKRGPVRCRCGARVWGQPNMISVARTVVACDPCCAVHASVRLARCDCASDARCTLVLRRVELD